MGFAKQARCFGRVVNEATHILHEGRVEAAVECDRPHDGNQDRWCCCDDRKQRHDADMKPRSRSLSASRPQKEPDLGNRKPEQHKDDEEIGNKEPRHHAAGGRDRGKIRKDKKRQNGQQDSKGHSEGAKPSEEAPLPNDRSDHRLLCAASFVHTIALALAIRR